MGDEVKRCEVCGESECWALADWSMGGTPGEYEEAKAMHWRLGYERENARADAAQGLAATAHALASAAKEALAAARRECEELREAVGKQLDGECDCDDQHYPGDTCESLGHERCLCCRISAALAAPAAGEEGKR